jgi:hypothetical protein
VNAPQALPALSPAQLKAALWADASVQVYALILGRCVGGLPERLALADAGGELGSYDCLLPGALSPAHRQQAPYLVLLKQGSAFTDWLLQEAVGGFGEWGVLMCSRRPFLAMRSHCRECARARLPDGREIALDWMDPAVLRALLPLAPRDQVEDLLGPLEALVIAGTQAWTYCTQQFGRLQMQEQRLMAAAA